MERSDILAHFPGTPWESQARLLTEIARHIDDVDVVVIRSPVASGKSKIADCLIRWLIATGRAYSGALVGNSRLLAAQLHSATKGYARLLAVDEYECVAHGVSCKRRRHLTEKYCVTNGNIHHPSSCPLVRDLRLARSAKRIVVNQHIYAAHKLYRDVVCIDEAHTAEHLVAERMAKTLWRSEFRWPRQLFSSADVSAWLDSLPPSEDPRLEALDDLLSGRSTKWTVSVGSEELRGRETEFIRLLPLDIRSGTGFLFPTSIKKVVLMSATFSDSDLRALGLDGRRVLTVESDSEIPVDRRRIVYRPIAPMDFRRRNESIPTIAAHIRDHILAKEYPDVRGVLHVPYGLHERFRLELGDCDGRLVWATREGRNRVVADWLQSPSPNSVLVGSGLHEGLDLRDDLARFQVVVAMPRASIADPGVLHLSETDPERYEWLTVRELGQLVGRVSRHPGDEGTTIILDSTADRELNSPQLPKWAAAARVNDYSFRP